MSQLRAMLFHHTLLMWRGIKTASWLVPFNEPTKSDVVQSSSVYVKGDKKPVHVWFHSMSQPKVTLFHQALFMWRGIKTGSCLVPFNEPSKSDVVLSKFVYVTIKSKKIIHNMLCIFQLFSQIKVKLCIGQMYTGVGKSQSLSFASLNGRME
jgi:hypothetical protein